MPNFHFDHKHSTTYFATSSEKVQMNLREFGIDEISEDKLSITAVRMPRYCVLFAFQGDKRLVVRTDDKKGLQRLPFKDLVPMLEDAFDRIEEERRMVGI